jgi:hypothetical protein
LRWRECEEKRKKHTPGGLEGRKRAREEKGNGRAKAQHHQREPNRTTHKLLSVFSLFLFCRTTTTKYLSNIRDSKYVTYLWRYVPYQGFGRILLHTPTRGLQVEEKTRKCVM